ncbi:MAG: hypothetical protein OWT28_04225 [Firmicutes bacterium]|nr:hypothetical protein [Bacillota bacterium]
MLDIAILCIISWLAWTGYRLGGTAALIQLSGTVGMLFVLEKTSPWIRLLGHDAGLEEALTRWLMRLLDPVLPVWRALKGGVAPASTAPGLSAANALARTIYLDVTTGGYAVAIYFGLHMALKSLETLWPYGGLKYKRPLAGAVLGTAVGVFASLRVLQVLSLWIYLHHFGAGEELLYHSAFVHAWTGWFTHGIVE